MNIALVIPPSSFLIDDRVFPFLGPLQIAALARQEGHEVRVIDLTGYKRRNPDVVHANPVAVLEEALESLKHQLEGVELLGFYSLAAQHPMVVRLLRQTRETHPHIKCALGGPHANTSPQSCVADGFDYVVVSDQGGGGGEQGFLELVARVQAGTADRIIKLPSRTGAKWEGDLWPLPARDLIDLPSYYYYILGERATSIVSYTGCPFACTFCSHWDGYRKSEGKSSPRVLEEIEGIKSVYGIRGIMFYDDEINLRKDFTTEFLPMLKKADVKWRAFFKNGQNLTRQDVFEKMADAGCAQLCTGAESADPQILKNIKKMATLEQNTNFVKWCLQYGIMPKVFTQVGLPGETPESIEALRKWLIMLADMGLKDADVTITTPYEGTPIFDFPDQHQITFDKAELNYSEEMVFYKSLDKEYKSYVSHPRLTREDIVAARQMVEDDFRRAAGLPLLNGDGG